MGRVSRADGEVAFSPQDEGRSAERVAMAIVREIQSDGWSVGTRIGSEAELIARYGVSRNVVRQAISMLESQGVVRVQTGRGGGVIVDAPETSPFSRALELYLSARGVSGAHVLEAKREVELTGVRLATRRRTDTDIDRLLRAVEREEQTPTERLRDIGGDNVHIVLAEMTGNPALHLFIEALTHLSAGYVDPEVARTGAAATFAAHRRIAHAVAAGDEQLAVSEMAAHLDDVDRVIRADR